MPDLSRPTSLLPEADEAFRALTPGQLVLVRMDADGSAQSLRGAVVRIAAQHINSSNWYVVEEVLHPIARAATSNLATYEIEAVISPEVARVVYGLEVQDESR